MFQGCVAENTISVESPRCSTRLTQITHICKYLYKNASCNRHPHSSAQQQMLLTFSNGCATRPWYGDADGLANCIVPRVFAAIIFCIYFLISCHRLVTDISFAAPHARSSHANIRFSHSPVPTEPPSRRDLIISDFFTVGTGCASSRFVQCAPPYIHVTGPLSCKGCC